jgi:hypothetical protein
MVPAKDWARLMELEGLSTTDFAVLVSLCWHYNSEDGRCDPGIRLIAREARVAYSTARERLDSLEARGVISRAATVGKRGLVHYVYWLDFLYPERPGWVLRPPPHGKRRRMMAGAGCKDDSITVVREGDLPDRLPISGPGNGGMCQQPAQSVTHVTGEGGLYQELAQTVPTASTVLCQQPAQTVPAGGTEIGTEIGRVEMGTEQPPYPPRGGGAAPATTTARKNRGKPRMREMEARFESRCPLCRSQIFAGDRIRVNSGGKAAHAVCPSPRSRPVPPSPGNRSPQEADLPGGPGDGEYRFEDEEEFGDQSPVEPGNWFPEGGGEEARL